MPVYTAVELGYFGAGLSLATALLGYVRYTRDTQGFFAVMKGSVRALKKRV